MSSTITEVHPSEVRPTGPVSRRAATAYSYLVDVVALLIVVQGLLAGEFLQKDGSRDSYGSWIDAHARVADLAIVLALAATAVAVVALRSRRDLSVGAGVLALLLVVEAYLGGQIRDHGQDSLTVVHIPLATALMGLSIWLVVRGIALRKNLGND